MATIVDRLTPEERAEVIAAGLEPATVVPEHQPVRVEPTHVSMADDTGPHAPAENLEEIYFEGSPTLRSSLARTLFWILLATAIAAAPFVIQSRHWVKNGVPFWAFLAAIGVGVLLVLVPILFVRAVRYRVTNYRIRFERGLLGRTIDTLELWHVDDIKLRQSLFGRILGVGTIFIVSNDETTPTLPLHGIPHPRTLFETLEQRIIAVKRQRGVVKLDTGL